MKIKDLLYRFNDIRKLNHDTIMIRTSNDKVHYLGNYWNMPDYYKNVQVLSFSVFDGLQFNISLIIYVNEVHLNEK